MYFVDIQKSCNRAFTLVEVMVSVALFIVGFAAIMASITPTGTDGHNQLRSYSTAIMITDWYVNSYESEIDREGDITSVALDKEVDVTTEIKKKTSSNYSLLRDFQVLVTCSLPKIENKTYSQMYQIKVDVRWSKSPGDGRPYHYEVIRWKVKPYI